jgi:hypothetical protein
VEKYGTARQATDDNIMRSIKYVICMPDKYGKNADTHHALIIFNTYCFSMAAVVTRTRLTITLYLRCLFCYIVVSNILIPYQTIIYRLAVLCFVNFSVHRYYTSKYLLCVLQLR